MSKFYDEKQHLKAVEQGGFWTVVDERGGCWWPTPETDRKIRQSADPATAAVELCDSGADGTWNQ